MSKPFKCRRPGRAAISSLLAAQLTILTFSLGQTTAAQKKPDGAKVSNKSAAENGSESRILPLPPMPKPEPASRAQLPLAFTRSVPGSISQLREIQEHVEALSSRLSPVVVAVEVGDGSGSGVIISPDGLVLTAGHVCGVPNKDVRFTFPDGKTARGKTLGLDSESDCGLMKITDTGPWRCAPVGDLKEAHLGDWVLALGHPGGFDLKRSLVVRLGRVIELSSEAVQTDCTISPGDSGGPLFDMHGRVIGIHSFISGSTAENFHVPVTAYYDSWPQLVKAERREPPPVVAAAYLGATVVDETNGCRVTVVEKDGPASKAGLKVGDLVLKVEGRQMMVASSFQRWVTESSPGDHLALEVKRGKAALSLEVTLGDSEHLSQTRHK